MKSRIKDRLRFEGPLLAACFLVAAGVVALVFYVDANSTFCFTNDAACMAMLKGVE